MQPNYQEDSCTMTVDELRKKLKNIRGDAKVYVLLDKREENWDYDHDCWKFVHPIENAEKEWVYDVGFGEVNGECNCILHLQDAFYDTHKVEDISKF